MNLTCHYLAGFWHDIDSAHTWYENRVPKLGLKFRTAVEAAIFRVIENPLLPAEGRFRTRRTRLIRFPYSVVYQASETSIVFIGVVHGKQHFLSWMSRRMAEPT